MKIFTIGHGNRSFEDFLRLLQKYEIEVLVDVRSFPVSRFDWFHKAYLEAFLPKYLIQYKFMGDTLGGKPSDPSCYTVGRVDYCKIREKGFFKRGISQLKGMSSFFDRIALMCSESDPRGCHRTLLVSEALKDVLHIDGKGEIILHKDVIPTVNVLDLFG